MFLSDFSIKRPVATVVIIIALMGLGLLALTKLRVNQIPDVEQPVLVVTIPYPGASPETVEREVINRIEKSLQSISGVDQVRSTAERGQRADRADLQLQQEHDRGRRRGAQRHRHGAPQAADRDPRAGADARRPGGAADHAAGAVVDEPDACRDLAPGRRRAGRPASAASPAWPRSTSTARCGASCRCCCTPRSCASTRSRSPKWWTRCARRTPPRRWARCAARSKTRASAWSAASSRRPSSSRSWSSAAATRSCGSARSPAWQDGFAELTGYSMRNGQPNVGLSITRSRDASTVSVADRGAQAGRRDQQDAARGHQARSHAGRRQGRAEQPEQRDRRRWSSAPG